MYWYEKGKELGDPRCAYGVGACYDLGANFYYNGVGTERNLRLSEYYLKMAVDAGLPRAKAKFEQYKDTYESEIEK